MIISSTAFQPNQSIPAKYSYRGGNVSPPLTFSEIPEQAKCLVLMVEDPDAPSGTFTHWILYNIPPSTALISEGSVPEGARQATNDFGQLKYGGPAPPSGIHRYIFKLFALDTTLNIQPQSKRTDVYSAMEGHSLGQAELVGLFGQ